MLYFYALLEIDGAFLQCLVASVVSMLIVQARILPVLVLLTVHLFRVCLLIRYFNL